ncbi:MAG: cytochrome c-type biogenesis protein CcmH [Chloroflexi bacterium]|nr:cytochrome c-type biogenesis protein CcmH [Chloroflexota bacterium]
MILGMGLRMIFRMNSKMNSKAGSNRLGKSLLIVSLAALMVMSLGGTALADAEQDRQVREIAQSLECPVCDGQSVADSSAPLAQDMKSVIRRKLAQGETRDQILQYFVDRYGEAILRDPPKQGFNQILWGLPVLGLIFGVWFLGYTMRRWSSRDQASTPSQAPAIPEDLAVYEDRLENELKQRRPRGKRRKSGNR